MQHFDVLVLGAGIAGVSTALHLQRRGVKVALIDRRGPGEETSYGNAGIIEASFVLPFGFPAVRRFKDILLDKDASARADLFFLPRMAKWLWDFYYQSQPDKREINGRLMRPLVESAVAEHQTLMQETDAEKFFRKTGRVKIYRTKQSFDRDVFERGILQKLGVPFDVMEAAEFVKLEPSIRPIFYRALRLPSSARVTDPGAVTAAYAARFVRAGGVFVKGDALDLRQATGGMWQAANVEAPKAVICLGPWAMQLLKPLGYHFPMGLKRGYHQHFNMANGAMLHHAIVDADIGYVISGCERGARITTGAEFAAQNAPPNPVQIARVLPYARELFSLTEPSEPQAWLGARPCTPDSMPILGKAPNHEGLWLNIGHGHSGFTIGPATGRLVSELIVGSRPFTEPFHYRPERF